MTTHFHGVSSVGRAAFTLVEMLVSIAILTIIMLVLATITVQVQNVWTNTNAKIEQFRSARMGFDTMTQRLGEATLDTYTTYYDQAAQNANANFYNDPTFAPTSFTRHSDLRFLSGPSSTTMAGITPDQGSTVSSQSVFFVAPVGYTLTSGNNGLTQLLNVCGYYLEFGPDPSLPAFYTSALGYRPRYRYRLMELVAPAENNSIYSYTASPANLSNVNSTKWISDAFTLPATPAVHNLAENVVALIFLPELGQDQMQSPGTPFPASALAPNYLYDTTSIGQAASGGILDSHNQLPPIVQVTMVALDEPSAIRLQAQFGAAAPNLGLGSLFQNAASYTNDLEQLQANLLQKSLSANGSSFNPTVALPKGLNFRVFSTTVSIKGAQWSSVQTN
jgi:uncharacterized protein (TIGR02599 family)